MMLKAVPGCTSAGSGVAPSGASQSTSERPMAEPSSATRAMPPGCAGPITSAAPASAKRMRASASEIMRARLAGVEPGASGATATPARSAPRNTAA